MDIYREPTREEKEDFRPLLGDDKPTPTDIFNKMLNDKEAECTKKRIPFCKRCAKYDFQEEKNKKIKDLEESYGHAKIDKIKINYPDLNDYCGENCFNYIKDSETFAQANVAKGVPPHMEIAKEYVCKKRGCKASVFKPSKYLGEIEDEEVSKVSNTKQEKAKNN